MVDSQWRRQLVSVNNSAISGYYLQGSRSLLLCETLALLDKRRTRLRTHIQVVNTLEFAILLSCPVAIDEALAADCSSSSVHWTDTAVGAGQKWCLPLGSLHQTQVDFLRVAPILGGLQQRCMY